MRMRMVLIECIAVLLVLMLTGTLGAVPVSTQLTSIADAFVASSNGDGNFGGAGALALSSASKAKGEMQSLMRFDGGTAKTFFDTQFGSGAYAIQSITLRMGSNFATAGQQPDNPIFNSIAAGSFEVRWMLDDSWVEGTGNPMNPNVAGVDFNSLPSFLSASDASLGIFNFAANGANPLSYSLALAGGLTQDILSGSQASLHLLAADADIAYLFNSRAFGVAGNRPTLIITADLAPVAVATPEPASLWLLGAAMASFLRRWRGT